MLQNYVKIALRNLRKHRGYTFINIMGLAVGLACCILILLFVQDERSYDRFHADADRIYRVAYDAQPPSGPMDRFAMTSRPVGRYMRQEFPEVEHLVRMNSWNPVITHQGQDYYDDTFFFAEPDFFDIFSFPLVDGDRGTALTEPYTLVMSASTADKYFGTEHAVGRTLVLNDTLTFTVAAVMADIPHNAHFTTDFVVSYETLLDFSPENESWLQLGTYTYLKLREGVSAGAFEPKMADLVTRHYGETLNALGFAVTLRLQALTDIYLHSDRGGELGPTSDVAYVYVFSAIALFVLLIACINFMNLATARSMERAREVGVRKVMGSDRGLLIRQFLSEAILMCVLALVVALALIALALPLFNSLSGKEMTFARLLAPQYALGLLGLTLLVGLLAGSYPAFLLSSFAPVEVLKGAFRSSARGVGLRKALVVFQFAVSVALIAGTTVVFKQLRFMQNQDLGFDKEQVLVIDAQNIPNAAMAQQFETAKAEFLRDPSVREASASNTVPGRSPWLEIYRAEGLAEDDSRRARIAVVDHDYVEAYGIEVVAGRDFSADFETDTEAFLVNEMAVESIGWGTPEDALGKMIRMDGIEAPVVGVIRDYHHLSLKQAMEPMILRIMPAAFNFFSLRVDTDDLPATMARLEVAWAGLFPGYDFETFFIDESFDAQYQAEDRLSTIFGTFAFIAILIACLGLFGLAAFTAQQRTKEIGVRKVMGASVGGIILMLSASFTRLVLVAIVLAVPAVYFGMSRWLETFPYHTTVGVLTFVFAGVLALLIAFTTVGYQSVKAAVANPVDSLRYE